MLFWMMGSLADATPRKVAALCPYALAGAAVLFGAAARLNLFSVGEENAAALGVDIERTKRIVFLAASLLTGVAVAFAGVIGFVGLLVPHAVRSVIRQRPAHAPARPRSSWARRSSSRPTRSRARRSLRPSSRSAR